MARLQGISAAKLLTTPLVQLILLVLFGTLNVAALNIAYCSGDNTGSSYSSGEITFSQSLIIKVVVSADNFPSHRALPV